MEITALTATNLNPKYLSCAKHFIDFWLAQDSTKTDRYSPLVIVVAGELPQELMSVREYCILFSPPEDIPDVFCSQFVRALYAPLVNSDLVITTDIDMFPLSLKVFRASLRLSEDPKATFHILRHVLPQGQYAICYNLASPAIWSEITNVQSLDDVSRVLKREFDAALIRNKGYLDDHGAVGWFSDQEFLYEKVNLYEASGAGRVKKYVDKDTGHIRLDRIFTPPPLNWLLLPLVLLGLLTDYHVHHPIGRHNRFVRAVHFLIQMRERVKSLFTASAIRSAGG
jgi:hypothetical protein